MNRCSPESYSVGRPEGLERIATTENTDFRHLALLLPGSARVTNVSKRHRQTTCTSSVLAEASLAGWKSLVLTSWAPRDYKPVKGAFLSMLHVSGACDCRLFLVRWSQQPERKENFCDKNPILFLPANKSRCFSCFWDQATRASILSRTYKVTGVRTEYTFSLQIASSRTELIASTRPIRHGNRSPPSHSAGLLCPLGPTDVNANKRFDFGFISSVDEETSD